MSPHRFSSIVFSLPMVLNEVEPDSNGFGLCFRRKNVFVMNSFWSDAELKRVDCGMHANINAKMVWRVVAIAAIYLHSHSTRTQKHRHTNLCFVIYHLRVCRFSFFAWHFSCGACYAYTSVSRLSFVIGLPWTYAKRQFNWIREVSRKIRLCAKCPEERISRAMKRWNRWRKSECIFRFIYKWYRIKIG